MVDDLAARVEGVAALAEPVRRALYLYVASQADAVSRDRASEELKIPRHTAKFHLDRLVAEGLLETEYRRPSGRGGPGAGRPSKLYRRSLRELRVSLPERRYDLAGQLMASAIEESTRSGRPVSETLTEAAAQCGSDIGSAIRRRLPGRTTHEQRIDFACQWLAEHGYEPRSGHGFIQLANCPFHALATQHPELVCGMNHALLSAAVEQVGDLQAKLVPHEHNCCVVILTPEPASDNR